MAGFSANSLLGSILHCSLMAYVVIKLRPNTQFLHRYGTSFLLLLIFFCSLRMLLMIPMIQQAAVMTKHISDINRSAFDRFRLIHLAQHTLFIIWGLSIAVYILYYMTQYIGTRCIIHRNEIKAEESICAVLDDIDSSCPIDIYISPDIMIPLMTGIIHPQICLCDHPYDTKDLYYIILHEYYHWKRSDTWKKCFCNISACSMWWNPVINMMLKEHRRLLELKCDSYICRNLNKREITEYIETLCRAVDQNLVTHSSSATSPVPASTKLLSRPGASFLKQRCTLLSYQLSSDPAFGQPQNLPGRILLIVLACLWFAVSFFPFS